MAILSTPLAAIALGDADMQALKDTVHDTCLVSAWRLNGAGALTPAEQHSWGRSLAAQLSADLLREETSLPPRDGRTGRPPWPAGLVGSISHLPSIVIACVAPSGHLASVGVDVVPLREVSAGFKRWATSNVVSRPYLPLPRHWALRCIAMKEAAYKALSTEAQEHERSFLSLTIDWKNGGDFEYKSSVGEVGRGRVSEASEHAFACAWRSC